ncbi:hypothetical protein DRP04_06350 [Archaeoglobales archaeon]|nr:MAG: hypothetical protein DRP04_06350 [Archaeoglobales archaeon]
MSFEKILEKRGIPIQIVKIETVNNNGILEKSEVSTVDTKAIIQPLKHEEIKYWNDLGYSKAQMKAYFKQDEDIDINDVIVVDGKRFVIKTFENHTATRIDGYKVAILGEEDVN